MKPSEQHPEAEVLYAVINDNVPVAVDIVRAMPPDEQERFRAQLQVLVSFVNVADLQDLVSFMLGLTTLIDETKES